MENEQREHEDLIRETGVNAYAEAIAEMLASVGSKHGQEMDEAQIEMIKQGIAHSLNPPRPRPVMMPPMPPPMTLPRIFREETDKGITVYDWGLLIQEASHYHRFPNGEVNLYWGNDLFIHLHSTAAAAFWAWQEEVIERSNWQPKEPSGEESNA